MIYEEVIKKVAVSRETYDNLCVYVEQLILWNKKINLVSPDTIQNLWTRHIIDALQLTSYIENKKIVADMGTGAGLPGMILAIAGHENICLIESDQKKCAFLMHIKGVLKLNIEILPTRIEKVDGRTFDIITARALASIDMLLTYAQPLLKKEGYCLFLKGENYKNELEEAQKKWQFKYDVFPSLTHQSGVIIKLSEVSKNDEDQSHRNIQPEGRRRQNNHNN